jgi:hypothetical protein
MKSEKTIFSQMCVVVDHIEPAVAHWAAVLGVEAAVIETIFPEGIQHVTNGQAAEYKDCRVAKYTLGNIILELFEPGPGMSPWRNFLEHNGPGVFHVCMFPENPDELYRRLASIGVAAPYHLGTFEQGFYSYVASQTQLGIELSINFMGQQPDQALA